MMVIQITLQDLLLFLICILGIVAGILLIPILWNTKKVIGIVFDILEANQECINKTIKTLPGISEDVVQISGNVRVTTDKLKVSVPVILQEVECVTGAAKGSIAAAGVVMESIGSGINDTITAYKKDNTGFSSYFHIIEEVLQIIYRTFSSGK